MSHEARFWFAPGVEVFAGVRVQSPPPQIYTFAIMELPGVVGVEGLSPADIASVQAAAFRLGAWSVSGDVVHYDLDSSPPRGWRWTAVNGSIHAARATLSSRSRA